MTQITWKYTIGDTIINYNDDGSIKRSLTIVDRKIVTKRYANKRSPKGYTYRNLKYYQYRCNVCGWDKGWMIEDSLRCKAQYRCSCCAHQTTVPGINDVATTHPSIIQYFLDKSEATMYTAHSDYKPKLICPTCGYIRNNRTIDSLTTKGFVCPICSDGISYNEKFMSALLRQLKIDFIPQCAKSTYAWCENYRYDFWFQYNKEEYLVETHGRQHYEEHIMPGISLQSVQQNDKQKRILAAQNGFDDQHYIILNCSHSDMDWIKSVIEDSVLNQIFDLSTIDWNLCHANAVKSLVEPVAKYWELNKKQGITCNDVAKIFGINSSTVRKYLKLGNQLGICQYSADNELLKNLEKARAAHHQAIVVLNNDMELVATFNSQIEAAKKSVEVLGVESPFNSKCVSRACCSKNNHWYRGYYIMYLKEYLKTKKE